MCVPVGVRCPDPSSQFSSLRVDEGGQDFSLRFPFPTLAPDLKRLKLRIRPFGRSAKTPVGNSSSLSSLPLRLRFILHFLQLFFVHCRSFGIYSIIIMPLLGRRSCPKLTCLWLWSPFPELFLFLLFSFLSRMCVGTSLLWSGHSCVF